MTFRLVAMTLLLLGVGACAAATANRTANDAQSAIAIAKDVCRGKADPSLRWKAYYVRDQAMWVADTLPSLCKSGDPLWMVIIPDHGGSRLQCGQSLYLLEGPLPCLRG
jgi:hypothetical protein